MFPHHTLFSVESLTPSLTKSSSSIAECGVACSLELSFVSNCSQLQSAVFGLVPKEGT